MNALSINYVCDVLSDHAFWEQVIMRFPWVGKIMFIFISYLSSPPPCMHPAHIRSYNTAIKCLNEYLKPTSCMKIIAHLKKQT